MKGLLQRLAARAGGRSEGLRPRTPNVFESGTGAVADMPRRENHGVQTPATHARETRGPAPLAATPPGVAPVPPRVEPARPAAAPAARHNARAAPPMHDAAAVNDGAPRPRRANPGNPASTPPAATVPATSVPAPPAPERSLRPPSTAAGPAPSRRRAPKPPWTFETAVPRFVPGGGVPAAAAARNEGQRRAPPSAEPVVRVTIERLDVHAGAPAPRARRASRADDRPDTLAEYARKRQEAKR